MNNRIKAIFFDIDGTLLTSHHKMSEQTILTLNELQKAGHKIVIATGRNYGSVQRTGKSNKKWKSHLYI